MRDINRIERICHDLERLWKQHPDQRLGQLLQNYAFPNRVITVNNSPVRIADIFNQEDDETDKKIIMNTDFQHYPASLCVDSTKKEKTT
jgi:hypothetical protein